MHAAVGTSAGRVDRSVRGTLVIDGSHGEGGGQVLRTALALSTILQRDVVIERIRAGRPNPGLAAQHVTAAVAIARLCNAELAGAALGSGTLAFRPRTRPQPGTYSFDVAEAREGGSAGAATLVLQTLIIAALFADGPSEISVCGGTHLPWSPPHDFLADVWRPFLVRMGASVEIKLGAFGFYPLGQGEIVARVRGIGAHRGADLKPVEVLQRGELRAVKGRALAANLPSHIPQRMADRARALLVGDVPRVEIRPERIRASSAGAGLFLTAEFDHVVCGFSSFGRRGKPSEQVAEEAVDALAGHLRSNAALDLHLADQVLLPLAVAGGRSTFTCARVTRHLETNAWVLRQFGVADIAFEQNGRDCVIISVEPGGCSPMRQDGWA